MPRNRPSKPNPLRSNIATSRSAGLAAKLCRALILLLGTAATLSLVMPAPISRAADGIEELLRQTSWGEPSGQLLRRFTEEEAKALPLVVDFGDSYADIVLTQRTLGGVPMVVFFQMDKATGGLKRIQFERPRHSVNPPSFRAISAALHTELGKPDSICLIPPVARSGYQAAAEERWVRNRAFISAIYRDTTLQAFEGCPFGLATGWCGLRGQLLVRIGSREGEAGDPCSLFLSRAHRSPATTAIERLTRP